MNDAHFEHHEMNGSKQVHYYANIWASEMNVPVLERREVVVVPPGWPDQSLLSSLTDRRGHQDAGRRLALRRAGAELRLLQLELSGLQVSQGSPGRHVRRPHAGTSL